MIEVIAPGTLTTVQDWPGRVGWWELGVPPSGPMDARSLRIANRLVGNPEGEAGLEITVLGPRLRIVTDATIALCGAPTPATLDGAPVAMWTPVVVARSQVLAVGAVAGSGMRSYLAISGGVRVRPTIGSMSTFVAARVGGEVLAAGMTLQVGAQTAPVGDVAGRGRTGLAPDLASPVTLRVLPGPHGAPEILDDAGLDRLFGEPWIVHHQSDRTGVRLIGPTPQFARIDGGVAGLHPSNVLDSAYGVGTIMLSGDIGVVVGVDGPSLGGFAAFCQVIRADLWRVGQLRSGDEVRLHVVTAAHAERLQLAAEAEIASLGGSPPPPGAGGEVPSVGNDVETVEVAGAHGPVVYRRAGEGAVLVDFGEPELDLRSRVRVHSVHEMLKAGPVAGVGELTPGVRSLHVQFTPERISFARLIETLREIESAAPAPESLTIAARAVTLPLAWRHSAAMLAQERYASVRADAPWLPDNLEFIRRINGLADEDAVQRIVAAAQYVVLGLGDVYMGAPIAVPLDPRHRLVTTKYTPARTWTPANAVGIGGAFLCVYGIEGPGGYQLIGRTVPIWYPAAPRPCLLDHFDQIRFELVPEDELEALRAQAEAGRWRPRTEPVSFSIGEHARALEPDAAEIARFTARREAAFVAEREAWRDSAGRAAASVKATAA